MKSHSSDSVQRKIVNSLTQVEYFILPSCQKDGINSKTTILELGIQEGINFNSI